MRAFTLTGTNVGAALATALLILSAPAEAGYKPYKGDMPVATQPAAAAEATEASHSEQALEHAKVAEIHGDAGHADILTEHAEVALVHAKAAEAELSGEAKEHMTVGIEHLNQAISHGKMGHADIANGHIGEAITHINASLGE